MSTPIYLVPPSYQLVQDFLPQYFVGQGNERETKPETRFGAVVQLYFFSHRGVQHLFGQMFGPVLLKG